MSSSIHLVSHGLAIGQPFRFANLIPDNAGPSTDTIYYVLAAGFGVDDFEFSDAVGGTPFALTYAITSGDLIDIEAYAVTDDGVMSPPSTPEPPTDLVLASASDFTASGHPTTYAIAQWTASVTAHARETVLQIVDYDPDLEDAPVWDAPFTALVNPEATEYSISGLLSSTSYAARIATTDVFGVQSAWSDTIVFESASTASVVNQATVAKKARGFVSIAPTTAPTLVQSALTAGYYFVDVTLPAPATAGNLLVLQIANRADPLGDPAVHMPDWNLVALNNASGGYLGLLWKIAVGGETTIDTTGVSSNRDAIYLSEWSGVSGLANYSTNNGSGTSLSGGATSSGSGSGQPGLVYLAAVSLVISAPPNNVITPGGGYTQLYDYPAGGGYEPQSFAEYLLTSGLSSSYTPTGTVIASDLWATITAVFTETGHAASWDREDKIIDLNDATYGTSGAITLGARVAIKVARMIGRAVVKVGYSASASRTMSIYGSTNLANSLDISTMTLLATRTFTSTGGWGEDDITFIWNPRKAYRHYVAVDATNVVRRFYAFEVYEGTLNSAIAASPITGINLSLDDALTELNTKIDALVLDDLADVVITSVADEDVVQYDSGAGHWVNAPGGKVIDDLLDVDTTSAAPTDGQSLTWDAGVSQWVPSTVVVSLGNQFMVADATADFLTTEDGTAFLALDS